MSSISTNNYQSMNSSLCNSAISKAKLSFSPVLSNVWAGNKWLSTSPTPKLTSKRRKPFQSGISVISAVTQPTFKLRKKPIKRQITMSLKSDPSKSPKSTSNTKVNSASEWCTITKSTCSAFNYKLPAIESSKP